MALDAPTPFLRGRPREARGAWGGKRPGPIRGLDAGTWTSSQERPTGRTPTLSASQARQLLAAPDPGTVLGLRDRAILALGLHLGATRTEIAALHVRDFQASGGFDCLRLPLERVTRRLPVPPEVALRLREYLAAEGHADQPDEPLFRVVRRSSRRRRGATALRPSMIDQIVRKYTARLGLGKGYATLTLRATYLSPAMQEARRVEALTPSPPS